MQGFIVSDYSGRYDEARQWISEKLKSKRAEAALARLGRLGGRAGWAIHAVPQPEYGQARGESR